MKRSLVLEVNRATLHRDGAVLVRDISLRLGPGTILAIVGPNGAGKSSFLKAILGLWPIASGSISIDGRSLAALRLEERARLVGYVPQSSALNLNWTVQEVVHMGRFAHRGERGNSTQRDRTVVAHAMVATNTWSLAPRSYLSLSGGERGRVLMARALATEAPLLLLDEPTHSLDAAHAIDCLAKLRLLRGQGKTIVIVTHDLNTLPTFADEVLLMQAGRARALGTPEDVLRGRCLEEVLGVRLIAGAAFGYSRVEGSSEATVA